MRIGDSLNRRITRTKFDSNWCCAALLNNHMKLSILTLVVGFFVAGCSGAPRGFPAIEGIANFDQVNEHLYRGAQPNKTGLQ